MRIEEHPRCSSHLPPLVLTIKRKEQTMTSKEMILFNNTPDMNVAFVDVTLNVKVRRYFRPYMQALARRIVRGETILFDAYKNESLQAIVTKIDENVPSFAKLGKNEKDIIAWQWYYFGTMNQYDFMTKRKG